jgi:uncharacterized protein YwgA
MIYLLEQLGLDSGSSFEYHYYGPYSEAVSDAINDAKFWGNLAEETNFRKSDGAPFSTFITSNSAPDDFLGGLTHDRARELLRLLDSQSSTVLELAATIHWLAFVENVPNWREEIEVRKAGKTGGGRLEKALTLLGELGLAPS